MKNSTSSITNIFNQPLVRQEMELYQLGIELDTERQKLNEYADSYGMSDPITEEQSVRFDKLHSRFIQLEMAYLEASKNKNARPLADAASWGTAYNIPINKRLQAR